MKRNQKLFLILISLMSITLVVLPIAYHGKENFEKKVIQMSQTYGVKVSENAHLIELKKVNDQIKILEEKENQNKYQKNVVEPILIEQNNYCQQQSFNSVEEIKKFTKLAHIIPQKIIECKDNTMSFIYEGNKNEFWVSGNIYREPPKYEKNHKY